MAITAVGWAGTVDEKAYAERFAIAASDGVSSIGAWALSQGSGRAVAVAAAAGALHVKSVLAKGNSGNESVPLPTPSAGQWFLIVARVNWNASVRTVSLVAIPGGATGTSVPTAPPSILPAGVNSNPGVLYDYPLGWAWANSNNTNVTLFDLRDLSLEARLDNLEALSIRRPRGTAAERDARYGAPTAAADQLALQGTRWFNTDLGTWQQYYAARSTSNPLGATAAGWVDDYSGDKIVADSAFNSGWGHNGGILYNRVNGNVYLSGIITRSNATGTGVAFALPVGFQPPNRVSGLTQASGQAVAEFAIRPGTGNVEIANNRQSTTSMTITATWPAVL